MAGRQTFAVQAFERDGDSLAPGLRDAVSSQDEALALACARAAIYAGAIALCYSPGQMAGVSVLGTFGAVPHEFVEILADYLG
jgi:hypothetical protein